jgi:hypothetical protein
MASMGVLYAFALIGTMAGDVVPDLVLIGLMFVLSLFCLWRSWVLGRTARVFTVFVLVLQLFFVSIALGIPWTGRDAWL